MSLVHHNGRDFWTLAEKPSRHDGLLHHQVSAKTYKTSVIKKNVKIVLRDLRGQNLEEESGNGQNQLGIISETTSISVLNL